MNKILEYAPEQIIQTNLPQDPFVVEEIPSGGESASALLPSESIGNVALTLANESATADAGMTDERGNLLPVQGTDLREVANDHPWALEGPSIHRFVSLDVPRAIVKAYRSVPPEVRGKVVRGSSSDIALAALAAGYGWQKGFWPYAASKGLKSVFNPGGPGPWENALDW